MQLSSLLSRVSRFPASGRWSPRAWSSLREFFAYHGVWAIGVKLLRRLSIRDKTLLILALTALPLVPMGHYLVSVHSDHVREAERLAAGARLVAVLRGAIDHLHDAGRSPAAAAAGSDTGLAAAIEGLEAARASALQEGLDTSASWPPVEAALNRARQGAQLSEAGRHEALAQARLALMNLHATVLESAGFLLTREREILDRSVLTYVALPRTIDDVWLLDRALSAHVSQQPAKAADAVRITPSLLGTAGRIEALEVQATRLEARLAAIDPGKDAALGQREMESLRALTARAHSALLQDGQVDADELGVLRGAQDAVTRDLNRMLKQELAELIMLYEEQRDRARVLLSLLIVGTAMSLGLALYLFYAFYLVMRGGLRTVNDQMQRLARGDLSHRVRPLGGDEVAETLSAVSVSVERLAELLASVRHGSSSVSQAAQQIATGNSDLRSRNHRTSESLQRVVDGVARYSEQLEASAAEVEKVVATVQALRLQSTRSRRQMDLLRETLDTVRHQSQQVQEAVSLIDNVAFRTNILALNASVEASKAGESGRGFAVVAQEVRSLALRSAESARRISSIVAASAEQVEQSARLAEDTGRGITESDGHIDLIHGAMGGVASLTREGQRESTAILEQVRALRETTEKNLGLVEQLANASHSLRSHGERLTHRLSNFRLG